MHINKVLQWLDKLLQGASRGMMQQNANYLQSFKWQPLHCALTEHLTNEKWISSTFADSTSIVLHMEASYLRLSCVYKAAQREEKPF